MRSFIKVFVGGWFILVSAQAAASLESMVTRVQPRFIEHLAGGSQEVLVPILTEKSSFSRTTLLSYAVDGFQLELAFIDQGTYVECSGTILSSDGAEHCMTVDIAIPVDDLESFRWDRNIDDSQTIQTDMKLYSEYVDVHTQLPPDGSFNAREGSNGGYGDLIGTGQMSFYPLASISSDDQGYTWAVDMGLPLVFRLNLQTDRGMVAEFDLGISPKTKKYPNRSHFKLLLFEHDAQWGFRSALAAYYDIQKDYFKKRV
ncbi:MAG: hypothetical protein K9M55_09875, partial [Candidatus Marinimicrobia bacterium]|nr:hypothetical protein [Candidatus Neomarinimicrobiota bacterium]